MLILPLHIACGVSIWDDVAGADMIYKSVYQALVLGFLECGSFKITVENEATIGAFRGMIYLGMNV